MADYESYHEVGVWKEQLFTESCVDNSLTLTLLNDEFETLFGIYIAPKFEIAHLNFFENLFYYWPNHGHHDDHDEDMAEDAEEEHGGLFGDSCNYQGWKLDMFMVKVDFALALRSCEGGVVDTFTED